jgi:hypothetical protein
MNFDAWMQPRPVGAEKEFARARALYCLDYVIKMPD